MYSFLPDELLKEILAPALQVPDQAFACVVGRSPFSNYNPTTSAYLLVCKDWLRVATPLLYSVVVLRSKAQIQALESALIATPVLAHFIKKLRIESGYCISLFEVLRSAKDLTDLCVSLEIYHNDNVSGLCKGLAYIRPRRLIIYDHRRLTKPMNQKTRDLTRALQDYIPKWEASLTNVTLPWMSPGFSWSDPSIPNQQHFIDAITKNKSIQCISFRVGFFVPHWFDQLTELPNLKDIVLTSEFPAHYASEFTRTINPKLRPLITFQFKPLVNTLAGKGTEASTSQKATPKLNGIATFPDEVWTNILLYAMGMPELESEFPTFSQSNCTEYRTRFRRQLPFVCKKFYELAIPLHYRCVVVSTGQELTSLNTLIRRNEEIGRQVKTLLMHGKNHNGILTEDIHQLLASTPNLRRLSNNSGWYLGPLSAYSAIDSFDLQALEILAQKAGSRLVDLTIQLRRSGKPRAPEVFYRFTALRHLDISSSAVFAFQEAAVRKDALSHLETLTCSTASNTFLLLLRNMDLPRIHTARFPSMEKCQGSITFLRQHGYKLTTLECGFLPGMCVFDACPNLTLFEIPREKPRLTAAEFFSSSNEHSLQNLRIKTRDVHRGAGEKETFRYLANLDLSKFPSLRQIQVDRCSWPVTENEIKKSHWVAWAERLQELYNVDIVNPAGQKWVPRLRPRKGR